MSPTTPSIPASSAVAIRLLPAEPIDVEVPGASHPIDSVGIPQANQLSKVRQLVAASQRGRSSPKVLGRSLGLDVRHVAYYRRAAEILGLVETVPDQSLRATERGKALLNAEPNSDAERQAFRSAIGAAPSLRPFWSYFEGTESLSIAALTRRICDTTGLKESTADRRAQCLDQWRATLRGLAVTAPTVPTREELPARIADLLEQACRVMRHAIEHYNSFSCPIRSLVVAQHADQAMELLLKANLAVNGCPEALESEDYDIRKCVNVTGELPAYRNPSIFRRPPLLWLLHKHRNHAQHIGEPVEEDLLTLLVTHATVTFLEWAHLFFGLELHDVFPRRGGLALPTLDLDLREVCDRQIERLRSASKRKERIPADQVRASLFLVTALDPQLSDEEKEAIFTDGTPRTPFGTSIIERLRGAEKQFRTESYSELADFLESSPALEMVSKSAGRKMGAVPVYNAPNDPNAVPVRSPISAYILSDAGSLLQTGLAMWRTARSEKKIDFISQHTLLRLYRSRSDPALTDLKDDEAEALALSAMKRSLPHWAWLSRMEPSRIFHWAKRWLDDSSDFDLLRPLGSVLVFASGEEFRQSILRHERDKRSTIRGVFRKYLTQYSSPSKLVELKNTARLYHPSEMADVVSDLTIDDLEVSISTATGAVELRSLLSAGEEGLEDLRTAFPTQADEVAALIARWMTQVRSNVVVQFALDQYWHSDTSIRNNCRQMLRKFDLVAYCPFLGA